MRLWEFSERKIVSVMIGDGSGDFRVSKAMRFWAHNPREGKRLLKREAFVTRTRREKRWPPNTGALSLHGPSPSLGAPRYVGHFPVALRFIRPLPEAICNYPKYTQSYTQRAPPKCMIRLIHASGQVDGVDSVHAACLPWRQRIVYLETLVLGVRDVRKSVRVIIDSETRPWQSASDSCDLLR